MRLKTVVLPVCLSLFCGSCMAQAQGEGSRDAPKHRDTQRLMELVGTRGILRDLLNQNIDAQIAGMRRERPDVPASFWQDFATEFKRQADPQELMDMILPIYDRHFTQAEIRQLIAFYESPLGRKISTTLPEIQRESIEAGRQWGEQLGERMDKELQHRLQRQGYRTGR